MHHATNRYVLITWSNTLFKIIK